MDSNDTFEAGRRHGQEGLSKAVGANMPEGLERERWFQGYELGYQERWQEVVTLPSKGTPACKSSMLCV